MNLNIQEIQDKALWESFLLERDHEKTFLQSWSWGEFQEKMGNKIWRLGIYDDHSLAAVALVTKISAKRGTFLLIQHGPLMKEFNPQVLIFLRDTLKEIAQKEKASFLRMNPLWERNMENIQALQSLGFKQSPMHANAYEATWKLSLVPSEEELFGQM